MLLFVFLGRVGGYRIDFFNHYNKKIGQIDCFGIQLHLGDAKAGTRHQYVVQELVLLRINKNSPSRGLATCNHLGPGDRFWGNQTIQTVFIILGEMSRIVMQWLGWCRIKITLVNKDPENPGVHRRNSPSGSKSLSSQDLKWIGFVSYNGTAPPMKPPQKIAGRIFRASGNILLSLNKVALFFGP